MLAILPIEAIAPTLPLLGILARLLELSLAVRRRGLIAHILMCMPRLHSRQASLRTILSAGRGDEDSVRQTRLKATHASENRKAATNKAAEIVIRLKAMKLGTAA
jgi:hypothetical protein